MSLPIEEERWLPVPGYEGLYEVSDQGRVRSLDRFRPCPRNPKRRQRVRGRLLKAATIGSARRRAVGLSRDGKLKQRTVYTLVLEAFVGPRPPGMNACHNDGNASNDRLENLRWDTQSENIHDAVRHGTHNESKRTRCPLGHALALPNLVPASLREGKRQCLACNRAGSYARSALRTRGQVVDRVALAHDHYALIMSGVAPVVSRRRRRG